MFIEPCFPFFSDMAGWKRENYSPHRRAAFARHRFYIVIVTTTCYETRRGLVVTRWFINLHRTNWKTSLLTAQDAHLLSWNGKPSESACAETKAARARCAKSTRVCYAGCSGNTQRRLFYSSQRAGIWKLAAFLQISTYPCRIPREDFAKTQSLRSKQLIDCGAIIIR